MPYIVKALWICGLAINVFAQNPPSDEWVRSFHAAERAINRGDTGEAQRHIDHLLQVAERPDLGEFSATLYDLAQVYSARQMSTEAEALCRRLLTIQENTFPPEDPRLTVGLSCLANVYKGRGDYIHAEPLYLRLLTICEKDSGRQDKLWSTLDQLSEVYKSEGKYAEFTALWESYLKRHGSDGDGYRLVTAYMHVGRFAEAEKLLTQALSFMENNPTQATTVLNDLTKAYIGQHKYSEAEASLKRALSIRENELTFIGRDSASILPLLETRADLLRKMGRDSELVDRGAYPKNPKC